jgi:ABC-2 type transport system permease protein
MTTHTLELAQRVADAPGQRDRRPFGKRINGAGGRTRRVIKPHTFLWLASHEFRLAWRDWMALMTLGRRRQMRNASVALIIFGGFMHLLSYSMIRRYAGASIGADKPTLILISGIMLLSFSLLLAQAMESVTRVFYSRSDLELILTSPISPRKLFSVRIGRITIEVALLAMLLAAPSIDVLALLGGARWLLAYSVVTAMAAVAAAFAVALTLALFRIIGPKHTRLIAQILAAVIGAAFVIGLQIAAIFSYGTVSVAPLQSAWLIAHVPDIDSPAWWPARAMLGDPAALLLVVTTSIGLLTAAILIFAGRFGDHVLATAGVSQTISRVRRLRKIFRSRSVTSVLRRKEWRLLARDPWLMSQSLMQILYLLPPALFLWRILHKDVDAYVVLVPMIVMAAGHLGGGLAWLSISGEDAPDLVGTAPISAQRMTWAKIEAVMAVIACVFAPLVALLGFASTVPAVVAGICVLLAAASAMLIQLCLRKQVRRSQFRHRHIASRIATFAEAFSSIAWAATSALAAAGTWPLVPFPAIIAVSILCGVRLIGQPITQA